MADLLAPLKNQPSPPSSRLSAEGWERAKRRLATIENLTEHSSLIDSDSCDRIIAAADESLRPCTRDQATSLVAELVGAYPDLAMAATPKQREDFRLYTVKIFEAISQFSFEIGKAIVSGRSGVPATTKYKPVPADVVAFGKREAEKRQIVRTMAYRHKAEAKRRAEERAEQQAAMVAPRDPERIAALLQRYRMNTIVDPCPPRLSRHEISP